MNQVEKGELLRRLHEQDELLSVVNVWDVASARVVAGLPGTRALASSLIARSGRILPGARSVERAISSRADHSCAT